MNRLDRQLRVLVVSKRQYMSHDLIDDRYGRFREIPLGLSQCGAVVAGICVSYRSRPQGHFVDSEGAASVSWHCLNLPRALSPAKGGMAHVVRALKIDFRPDIVWAGSDAFNLCLGALAAQRLGVPFAADLYDDFDSYPAAKLPGVRQALRWSVGRARLVTVISTALSRKTLAWVGPNARVEVVTNAVPEDLFKPMDQHSCRSQLGLPDGVPIIGLAGAISSSRGVDALWRAVEELRSKLPNLHLAVAGPVDGSTSIPQGEHVHFLGMLPSSSVPVLINSLDVAVICNRDSEFGRYCFPQKLYEYLACGVPVVAAGVGSVLETFENLPQNLYAPDDADSLAGAILAQLDAPSFPRVSIPTWPALAASLHELLSEVAQV